MATAIDPVCKMEVDTENPNGGQTEYQGGTYYFCAPGCKIAFEREADQYLSGELTVEMHEPAPQKVSFFSRIFGRGS